MTIMHLLLWLYEQWKGWLDASAVQKTLSGEFLLFFSPDLEIKPLKIMISNKF